MSDVLVKGMKMPKSCEECPFFDGSWCNAQPMENWRTSYFRPSKGERQESCPLIPVAEHGRLIEAHFDYEKFKKRYKDAFGDNFDLYNAFSIFNDMIVNAPTVLERTT